VAAGRGVLVTKRLLVIDDDEHIRSLILRILARDFPESHIRGVSTFSDFVAALEEPAWAAIVADDDLRWYSALEVLRLVRAKCPGTPVIVVSASLTDQREAVLTAAGAARCLTKQAVINGGMTAAIQRCTEDRRDPA
jgi:DNA-binding NtrC family response regulator